MKKAIMAIAALAATMVALTAHAATWTDPVTGITWTYTVRNDKVLVGGGSYSTPAVPKTTTGTITVPSTLGGKPVTSLRDYAFYECGGLTSVTIPDGVTNISDWAFSRCGGLTSITIPNGLTSIGHGVFRVVAV